MEATRESSAGGEILQLVSFTVGGEEFGVDILRVQEIHRVVEITRVPRTPPFVEGMIHLRGRIIPVISLRRRFGMPSGESDKDTRILVVESGNGVVGFLVDAVNEVVRITRNRIEPPPQLVTNVNEEYIAAVAKRDDGLLLLLDIGEVISGDMRQMAKAAGMLQRDERNLPKAMAP